MELIARKRCFYGKWRQPGERFTADRARGRALVALKQARTAAERAPLKYSTRAVPAEATERAVMAPATPVVATDLKELRSQFRATFGRPPHHTWDADKIREKLAD